MADMFEIPQKGSPLDIARHISSDERVLEAVEELIHMIAFVAHEQGATKQEIKQAIENVAVGDLRAIIDGAIESGFEHVLSRRGK